MFSLTLPNKVKGQYWMTDLDEKGKPRQLVSIEALNDVWTVKSNKKVRIFDGEGKSVESYPLGEEVQEEKQQLTEKPFSRLSNWPVQIKLAPIQAPYFEGAKLLIAADCTAYAYASMHDDFMKGKVTLIGCPKLDAVDYSEKLTQIIAKNDIQSVTIIRMEVPCCGGLEMAAKKALQASGKFIPWQVVTVGIDGTIKE